LFETPGAEINGQPAGEFLPCRVLVAGIKALREKRDHAFCGGGIQVDLDGGVSVWVGHDGEIGADGRCERIESGRVAGLFHTATVCLQEMLSQVLGGCPQIPGTL
jgi:hypothetical protein